MILNVSGRTDIPAFYSNWFINRYKAGFLDVRNPFYPKLVSRIYFKDVDLILFCTKNPLPILKYLKTIKQPIIFHITLTPYGKDIEPNIISKTKIIEGIKELSKIIDPKYIYIRYDPIFLNDKYTLEYHRKAFTKLCNLLAGYTKHIIVSFIDNYKNVENNLATLKIKAFTKEDYAFIGKNFSSIASTNHMTIQTCSEENTLFEYGFLKEDCLPKSLAYKLTGKNYKTWSARHNKYCHCANMVDIGVYNSCPHFCKYCYANYNEKEVVANYQKHNPNSSLLIGELTSTDEIKIRKD